MPTQPLDTAAIEARLVAHERGENALLHTHAPADIQALLDRVKRLEEENRDLKEVLDEASDLATDMIGYVPDYFRLKHKHDEALEGLRERLEGRGQ